MEEYSEPIPSRQGQLGYALPSSGDYPAPRSSGLAASERQSVSRVDSIQSTPPPNTLRGTGVEAKTVRQPDTTPINPVVSEPRMSADVVAVTPGVLDQVPLDGSYDEPPVPLPRRWSPVRVVGLALIVVGLVVAMILTVGAYNSSKKQAALNASLSSVSSRLKPQSTSLTTLSEQLNRKSTQSTTTLTVNGNVAVTNSLDLQPSTKPSNATAGQLYYDQNTNQLGYYDGKGFVYLQGGGNITNITNAGNTTITNSITNTTSGVSGSGTSGNVAVFTGNGTLGSSVVSETGSTVSIEGTLRLQGSTDSTTALQVDNAAGDITLLNVDTANNEISLGTGAGTSLGTTSIGPFGGAGSGLNRISAQKVTTTSGGAITSMSAYVGLWGFQAAPYNKFQFAMYSDNAGDPGTYIASSAVGTLGTSVGWYTLPITATLSPNTTYWLVYWQNDDLNDSSNGYSYFNPVAGALNISNTYAWQGGTNNGMPSTFPLVGAQIGTNGLGSIYASFSGAGPALTVNQYGTLTQNGAATFQDPTDSTQAVQIQNSLGTELFTADTANMAIDIGGAVTVTGTITVDGHIVTGGSAPTIAAGAAACTAPTVSIAGNDTSGTVTVTTGTGCSAGGTLATISFANAFGVAPHILLTPGGGGSAGLNAYFNSSTVATSGFSIGTSATPTASTTYIWDYWVAQ